MKDEKTKFGDECMTNDGTQFDSQKKNAVNARVVNGIAQAFRPRWVKVGAGGASAGLLLGASYLVASNHVVAGEPQNLAVDAEEPEIPVGEEADDIPVVGEMSIPVAPVVNDDMTFGEAFAAARNEVGAGGAFEWHGRVYSTYSEEEWNELSEEQQSDYSSQVMNDSEPLQAEIQGFAEVDAMHENVTDEAMSVMDATDAVQNEAAAMEDSVEIEVLGVVHDDAAAGVDVVNMPEDNSSSVLVDVNENEVAVDVDYAAEVADNEIVGATDDSITLEHFSEIPDANDNFYASNDDLPDYTNDANVDSYNA